MRKFLMTTAATICLLPGAAAAQQTSQPPVTAGETTQTTAGEGSKSSSDVSPEAQTLNSTGLGDIIVTAQRRSENVQKAAIAISVVGGADLINNGIKEPDRLNSLVPALTIANVGPSTTSFIRGVGNFSVAITSDPAVAFNYDGVYVGRLTATSTTFFDTDRVEVLKGPQGTLYGRNATAGAINILPTQPKLGEFSGYGIVQYGDYNALSIEGAVNVPVGENGAVRLSAIENDRDGYNRDGTSDDKSQGVRLQIKAALTPKLTARLSFDYEHLGGLGAGMTYLNSYACSATTPTTPGETRNCVITPTGISRADGNFSPASQAFWTSLNSGVVGRKNDPFQPSYQNSDYFGSNADIELQTGIGTLTVIPEVRFDTVRNRNVAGFSPIDNLQKDIQYGVEARLAGKLSLFDYTLGFLYYNEDANLKDGALVRGAAFFLGQNENYADPTILDTQSYAPFLRLTAHLTSRLRLVGGVRYTHDDRQFDSRNITLTELCGSPPASPVGPACPTATLLQSTVYPEGQSFAIPTASGQTVPGPSAGTTVTRTDITFNNQLSFGRVTWRGAAEFDLAPASLLYASVETGFRSGGFNTAVGLETYQPEYITAYTVGTKNRFFDNRVQLNVEGFWWEYRNQQVAHATVDQLFRPGSYPQNIGRSTIKGVEAEGRVLVTPTTQLSADVQYLHARNDSFTYQQPQFLGYPYTNCAVTPVGANFNINCSGLPSYNSPTWTINLAGQQTVPIGDYKLVFTADTQYKTSRYTYFDYASEQLQPASWTTDAQVAFGPASGKWSVA